MTIDRIMGVVLSILVFSFYAIKYINSDSNENNPFELIGDNGYISENSINFDRMVLSNTDSTSDIIKFTNTNKYPIEMSQNDITINCTGTGETKEYDENLVSNNYSIVIKFSKNLNSNLYNSLLVPKGETIYIHVLSEYNGNMPINQVNCDYSLDIHST